jgi:hypothetical protein
VRKLLAILAALALLVSAPMTAMAGHKNGHKVPPGAAKNNPAPPDCAIEIDPLGICLG